MAKKKSSANSYLTGSNGSSTGQSQYMTNQNAAYAAMTQRQREAYQGAGRAIGVAALGIGSIAIGGGLIGGAVGAVRGVTAGLTSAGLAFGAGLNAQTVIAPNKIVPKKKVAPKTPKKATKKIINGAR